VKTLKIPVTILALALATVASARAAVPDTLAPFTTPAVLSDEHWEIHETLAGAAREPGRLGMAARTLAVAMEAHFDKEEEYAMPPLALLPMLARGETYQEMREILPVTDRLAYELPVMLEEHKVIGAAARELLEVARAEGRFDVARLAEQVLRHAQTEEQILYPAAILVGKLVEFRLGRAAWYPDSR
jgi:hypothetical protein